VAEALILDSEAVNALARPAERGSYSLRARAIARIAYGETGQRAGALLEKARMSSANAVDAFVVATALEFESAVIATADLDDLSRLSASYRQISLVAL